MALVANLLGFHDVHGDSCDYCQKGFGAVKIIILDGQRNWGEEVGVFHAPPNCLDPM